MLADFRYAARWLIKTPGFTAVAVLTLGLAIGVNSAVFAIVNGLVLRPTIPLHPEQVVGLFTARKGANHDYRQFSYAELQALRSEKDTFADVAAVQFSLAGIGRDEEMRRSFAFFTTDNYFALMGVRPALGRFYDADESRPNANRAVVVVSYSYWQRHGGKPGIIGQTVYANEQPYTVIGVTPDGFSGGNAFFSPDLWVPLGVFARFAPAFGDSGISDLNNPKNFTLNIVARLQPGVALASLQSRLPAISEHLTALLPADANGARELQAQPVSRFSISTTPSSDGSLSYLATGLFTMGGAVLLIACINLANMLLARSAARSRDMAVRLALGATRWRIVRQLLAEGLLLSLAGGIFGLILSLWANDLLLQSLSSLFSSMSFSIVLHLRPDATVLLVTLLFCVGATLLFSLGPALRSSRADLVTDLKQQVGEPAVTGRFARFFSGRNCLVMSQVALSVVLLFSATLFLRGALKASQVDLGFRPAGDVVTEMDFSLSGVEAETGKQRVFAALDRARQLPGVRQAGIGTMLPYGNLTNTRRVIQASAPRVASKNDPAAIAQGVDGLYTSITSGYFAAIGVKLVDGRDFTETESRDKSAPRVAIIDTSMAKQLFPNGNALGQHIRFTEAPAPGVPDEMEIVGICAAHRHDVLDDHERPRLFVPFASAYNGALYLHVRFETEDAARTATAVGEVRTALRKLDPNLPVLQVSPYANLVERCVGLWVVRAGAALFGAFGFVAFVLAIVGVYGVKAYTVARRTREIGIRMALGAQPRNVFALFMRQGSLQTLVAVSTGVLLALGAGQILGRLLYRISPHDPLALTASIVLLGSASLAACFLPALKATRVRPIEALRME